MAEINPRLLKDLAALAVKYSSNDWERLARWFEDDSTRSQLKAAVLDLAAVSQSTRKKRGRRAKPKTRSKPASTRIRDSIARMRTTDPSRADMLDDLWLRLRERELLGTMAALRSFSHAVGLKDLHAKRRDQAVSEVMERLVELPASSFEQQLRQAAAKQQSLGEDYESWVRLILEHSGPHERR